MQAVANSTLEKQHRHWVLPLGHTSRIFWPSASEVNGPTFCAW
jgi:hypothetical protein